MTYEDIGMMVQRFKAYAYLQSILPEKVKVLVWEANKDCISVRERNILNILCLKYETRSFIEAANCKIVYDLPPPMH